MPGSGAPARRGRPPPRRTRAPRPTCSGGTRSCPTPAPGGWGGAGEAGRGGGGGGRGGGGGGGRGRKPTGSRSVVERRAPPPRNWRPDRRRDRELRRAQLQAQRPGERVLGRGVSRARFTPDDKRVGRDGIRVGKHREQRVVILGH